MAHPMVTQPALMARQVNPTGLLGCTNYNFNAVDSCLTAVAYDAIPTCYNYYADNGCCKTWMSWYVSEFNCLQTAYSNCFNFLDYLTTISSLLPCYSGGIFTTTQKKPNNSPATTTPIPKLEFQSITYGTPTPTSSHAEVPKFTGAGTLLQGYCNTPKYVLLDGPTAFWAPMIGCADEKTDCCPFEAQKTAADSSAVTVVSTITVNVGPAGVGTAFSGHYGYPQAQDAQQATLKRCPADYVVVHGGCCPTGYQLWNEIVGGDVPCWSSLSNPMTPPVVPIPGVATASVDTQLTTGTSSTSTYSPTDPKPTSAVVNVVYAIRYPVQQNPGLSTGAKAGIGGGVGAAGLAIIVLALLLLRKYRHSRKDKETIAALSTPGVPSTVGSQGPMSSASPYAYSTRTELHSDGIQSPNSAYGATPQMGTVQNGYFVPSQSPAPIDPQTGMLLSPTQQIQRRPVPGQDMHYSPPISTASPVNGSDVNSFHTGYSGPPQQQWSPPQQMGATPPPMQQQYYQQPPPQEMGVGQHQPQQQYYQQPPPQEMSGTQPQQQVYYLPAQEMASQPHQQR